MSDEQQRETRRRGRLDAPERGSADELMDHGAAGELGPMRHSAAHVLAEAVLELFPGTKLGIGPVIDDGFYYDFQLPRPLTPDDLPGDRGADAREHRRRPPVRVQRAVAGRCAGVPRRARPAVQGRDRRRPLANAERDGAADAADDLLPAGAVHRPVPRPARGEHRQDRPVQAARHGRGVLARRREAADAPARLRDGMGDPGRARRSTCGAARRRASAITAGSASSSTCSASTTSARARPSGTRRASRSGAPSRRAMREPPGAARLPGDQHADRRQRATVAAVGALGPLPRQHVPRSSRRARRSASSR